MSETTYVSSYINGFMNIADARSARAALGIYIPESAADRVIYVSADTGTDDRIGLDNYDVMKPFQSFAVAESIALDGDLIWVMPGDYTGNTASGVNDVHWYFESGTINIIFDVTDTVTFTIVGDIDEITLASGSPIVTIKGDIRSSINISSGTLKCVAPKLTGATISSDSPVQLSGTGVLEAVGYTITSSAWTAISIVGSWSGNLTLKNVEIENLNSSAVGINISASITGDIHLIGSTNIITGSSGESISAPAVQDVFIQGNIFSNNSKNANVNLIGGAEITNANFIAYS